MNLRNVKQAELSRATGISKQRINYYVKGTGCPKSDSAYAIAKFLMVSPTWIMGFTDDDAPDLANELDIQTNNISIEKNSIINDIVGSLYKLDISQLKSIQTLVSVMEPKGEKQ